MVTGEGENFLSIESWRKIVSPGLKQCTKEFESASQHKLPIKGSLNTVVNNEQEFEYKPGLGLLKDFALDVKFKDNARLAFMKPRPVPFTAQEELNEAYDAGVKKGVWKKTQFSLYGTPVVYIRKNVSGDSKK